MYHLIYIFLGPSASDPSGLGRLDEANRSHERFCVLSDSVACVDLVNGLTTRRSACISQGKPLLELVHLNFFPKLKYGSFSKITKINSVAKPESFQVCQLVQVNNDSLDSTQSVFLNQIRDLLQL